MTKDSAEAEPPAAMSIIKLKGLKLKKQDISMKAIQWGNGRALPYDEPCHALALSFRSHTAIVLYVLHRVAERLLMHRIRRSLGRQRGLM